MMTDTEEVLKFMQKHSELFDRLNLGDRYALSLRNFLKSLEYGVKEDDFVKEQGKPLIYSYRKSPELCTVVVTGDIAEMYVFDKKWTGVVASVHHSGDLQGTLSELVENAIPFLIGVIDGVEGRNTQW